MSNLPELLAALLAFLSGVALARVPSLAPKTIASSLHSFVVWVALPALILARIPALEVGQGVLWLGLLPWVLLAISATLVWLAARVFHFSDEVTGALLLVVPLANTSFLGLPLVSAHLGPEAVAPALVWDQLGSFLQLSTWGAFILARYAPPAAGAPPARPTPKAILGRILRFPPFIALVLAFVLRALELSNIEMIRTFERIGVALVPAVMVAIGLQWRATFSGDLLTPFAFALVMRLACIPFVAMGFVILLDLPPLTRGVAILEAGMGPMITAGALAIEARIAPSLVASLLGWGTLISIGTTALWAAFL